MKGIKYNREKKKKNKLLSELPMLAVVLVLSWAFLVVDTKILRAENENDYKDSHVEASGSGDEEDTGELFWDTTQEIAEGMGKDEAQNPADGMEQNTAQDATQDAAQGTAQEGGASDAVVEETGSWAETETAFVRAPEGYFDDALFIGDSRTVGLSEYGGIEGADFFATTGMSVYNIDSEKVPLSDKGVITFEDLISQYSYGKIYIMLGINELGYDKDATVAQYKALVERIIQAQPEAIIFIEANLHVSAKRSASDDIYNNQSINYINDSISKLADNRDIFYIDVNELFDDENGNLRADTTMDGTHVLGRYYKEWADWIAQKAIIR